MEYRFPRTYGQDEAKQSLRQALERNRFPHALLVHGEAGLGQHALLLDLAQIFSCESDAVRPCGSCPGCKAFQNVSLESIHYLLPLVKKEKESDRDSEDGLESDQIDELAGRILELYGKPYGFDCPEKALVTVGQTRHLLSRLGYAESRRKARVVIVPFFESLNPQAANALLKTLEEPSEGVYFLIASEHRAALLPTLLSRCLHLGLAPLSPSEFQRAAADLAAQAGKPIPTRLMPLAEGSPGVFVDLLEQDGEALLEEALRFLSTATSPDWRVFAEYAEGWGNRDRGSEEIARLLRFLLRCLRLHQSLRVRHPGSARGREDGYRWTAGALHAGGWDASLAGYLGPMEDVEVPLFAAYVETVLKALKAHCRTPNALLGLFLEYHSKAGVGEEIPAGGR